MLQILNELALKNLLKLERAIRMRSYITFSVICSLAAIMLYACGKETKPSIDSNTIPETIQSDSTGVGLFRSVVLPHNVSGSLYLHSMPGRYDSLSTSVSEIEKKEIDIVISLTSLGEIRQKSPEYANAIDDNSLGFERMEFPIIDFGIPQDSIAFLNLAKNLAGRLKSGKNLLIHCGAGIGRTGTLAASVLISLGKNLNESLDAVRSAGSNPETEEQMDLVKWVADYPR